MSVNHSRFEIVFFALQRYSQRLGLCRTVKMVAHGAPRHIAHIWRFRAWSMKMMLRGLRAVGRRALRFWSHITNPMLWISLERKGHDESFNLLKAMVLFDDFLRANTGYLSTSLTCTCGSRAESFFGRMQVGSALAWHSYACIRARMSAPELLVLG